MAPSQEQLSKIASFLSVPLPTLLAYVKTEQKYGISIENLEKDYYYNLS